MKTVNLRNLPTDLINRAKAVSAWRGKTLKAFIIECITKAVAEHEREIHLENRERIK